jgi:hypothetical protein
MKPKPLTKEQILLAMRMTKSNRAASRYLNVSYIHFKMWARRYHEFEGGRNLFEVHKNQPGKGVAKFFHDSAAKSKWKLIDVIEGRIAATHFKPEIIRRKMIEEGYLKEECAICGFHDRRLTDYKMPLILNFKDNNSNHYNLGNIRFLCYNCYFISVGEIFNDKDMVQLETHQPLFGTTDAIDFQLDEYQMERLEKLGLYDPPKTEESDGSEFISRL